MFLYELIDVNAVCKEFIEFHFSTIFQHSTFIWYKQRILDDRGKKI